MLSTLSYKIQRLWHWHGWKEAWGWGGGELNWQSALQIFTWLYLRLKALRTWQTLLPQYGSVFYVTPAWLLHPLDSCYIFCVTSLTPLCDPAHCLHPRQAAVGITCPWSVFHTTLLSHTLPNCLIISFLQMHCLKKKTAFTYVSASWDSLQECYVSFTLKLKDPCHRRLNGTDMQSQHSGSWSGMFISCVPDKTTK